MSKTRRNLWSSPGAWKSTEKQPGSVRGGLLVGEEEPRTPLQCEGRKGKESKKKKEEEKGGASKEGSEEEAKVSVRNASLLEDNRRAGPVCFKSNQSIRINYPPHLLPLLPGPPLPSPPFRVQSSSRRHMGQGRLVCVRVCVCVVLSIPATITLVAQAHTQPPTFIVKKEERPIKIKL